MSKRKKLTDYHGLMEQWDFEKNHSDPSQMTVGSEIKAWWICDKGHSWKAVIKNRVRGSGCPYCTGKKVLIGFNDLQTSNPDLADEWDYDKNTLSPLQVTYGSGTIVYWVCSKGHSWKAAVCDRSKGSKCPICKNQKVLTGFNDLQTLKPDIAEEWAYEMNKMQPSQVTPGSVKKVWWKCEKGHYWEAAINSRNAGCDCPYCKSHSVLAGFNDLQTLKPELAKEWDPDKNELLPTQVAVMSNKVVWWICENGHSWDAAIWQRSTGSGCPYCRNQRVLKDFNDLQTLNSKLAREWDSEKNVLTPSQITPNSRKMIWWKCNQGHSWMAEVYTRSKGHNCPYCSSQRVLAGFNDLQTLNPTLAEDWDYNKNAFTPSQVTPGSNKKVWWKCAKGHSWKAQIGSRNLGSECPYCTSRLLLTGYNDLQTCRPDIADEWDYEKNALTPSQFMVGSKTSVWWKCEKGHSWKASINSRYSNSKRSSGNGCPYCAGKKVLPGFNDLETSYPLLSDEWDYEKNTLTPSQVTVASNKSVWWKCHLYSHSWKAKISSRSVGGNNCPFCIGHSVLTGFNDLATLNTILAKEWDDEKNLLTPSQVVAGSAKSVWWKCAKGHSWRAVVAVRHNKGTGCPYCSGVFPYTPRCVK